MRKDLKQSNCPLALWDYCIEQRARINNLTAKTMFSLHGSNAHTSLSAEEGYISNLCQFGWYDWCYYRDNTERFPFNREVLGRVLGPSSGVGNEMAQWVLKANGEVISRRTLRPLQVDELHCDIEAKKRETFNALIERRHGTSTRPSNVSPSSKDEGSALLEPWSAYQDSDESPRCIPEIEDTVDSTG